MEDLNPIRGALIDLWDSTKVQPVLIWDGKDDYKVVSTRSDGYDGYAAILTQDDFHSWLGGNMRYLFEENLKEACQWALVNQINWYNDYFELN